MNSSKYKSLVAKRTAYLVGTGMTLAAAAAQAAVDVTATVSEVGLAAAAVLLVGAAVIIVKVGIRLYKWASAAL